MSEISREQRLEIINKWIDKVKEYSINMPSSTHIDNKCYDMETVFSIIYPKRKTYKEDFLDKFPNAKLNMNGEPYGVCRNKIYGIDKECPGPSCTDCWNQEMEDTK